MTSLKTIAAHSLILLVDDNRTGLAARKHVLDELGYRTITATSANAALEQFSKQNVDLVVTDYRMPEMSGIDLIQKLRAVKPAIPVVLMSAFVDVLGLNESSTGADIVLQKSANEVQSLVRAVNRLLSRKTARKSPGSQSGLKAKRKAV
jgi:CheY-like chemotaxis protein